MQNYKNINQDLKKAMANFNFAQAKELMKKLEVMLQENIAADETRLENNEALVCVEVNEKIKDIIFFAQFEIEIKTRGNENWKPLKVYLDDKRNTPDGYFRVFWPSQMAQILEEFEVEEVSLDHDLGDDDIGTGYDVVCYIEEKVYFNRDYVVPVMKTHTDNSSARDKMQRGIKQILNMKK